MRFVSRNTGRADRQRHASVDPSPFQNTGTTFGMSMDSPIFPTAVSIFSMSGTARSTLTAAQTSMMGPRTSRRWGAGSRESWDDARVPRRRLRTGRTEKRRMSPRAGGGTGVYAHKGIWKEGDVWAKMKRNEKVEGILYFFPGHT
jgi:hypothetical protein